jgi:hypothetical protein
MSEREQNSWCFLHIYKLSNHKGSVKNRWALVAGGIVERIGALEGELYEKRDHDPGDRIYRL